MDPTAVTARLADLVAAAPGRLSVAVRARDGYRFDHDSARVVPAASTIKVPVLLAYLASAMPWSVIQSRPARVNAVPRPRPCALGSTAMT